MSLEHTVSSKDDVNIRATSSAEHKVVAVSEGTYSTTLSDKESVFSVQSENVRAPGTEISCDDHYSSKETQLPQAVRLQRVVETSPANVHGSSPVELQEIEQVTLRTKDLHLNEDSRYDDGYGDLQLPSFNDDTLHPGEDIFADYQIPDHNDFMADSAHKYWTWSDKDENWWHKDEETNTIIWAPPDFD